MKVESALGFAQNAGALVCGTTAVRRAVERGKVEVLVLAGDVSHRLAKRIKDLAARYGVPLYVWGTKSALGAAAGRRDVGIVAVCDLRFAEALREGVASGGQEKGSGDVYV